MTASSTETLVTTIRLLKVADSLMPITSRAVIAKPTITADATTPRTDSTRIAAAAAAVSSPAARFYEAPEVASVLLLAALIGAAEQVEAVTARLERRPAVFVD